MLDPAIQTFLSERQATWLKDKLKSCKSEAEQQEIENKAKQKYSLSNWLSGAAKRAGSLAISSHPPKFSHPSIKKQKISAVIANRPHKADGFLRSGNAQADPDVFGDAGALDVLTFLSLKLTDGQTVLSHLEQNSEAIKTQFRVFKDPIDITQLDLFETSRQDPANTFNEIRQGLLAIKQADSKAITSEKLKQVYFPVDDDYHLLSILTPSGLMFKLKERINTLRFSEDAKLAREHRRNQQYDEHGFDELYNLTVIGFGGANKQNISVMNSQNLGTAYLLSSMPPTLEKHRISRPNRNFFTDILRTKTYRQEFWTLHKLYKSFKDDIEIKTGIADAVIFVFQQVVETTWQIRQLDAGWSDNSQLSMAQKIWLDSAYSEQRETEDDWLTEIIADFARWYAFSYTKTVSKEQAIPLGDIELAYFKQLLADYREDLR